MSGLFYVNYTLINLLGGGARGRMGRSNTEIKKIKRWLPRLLKHDLPSIHTLPKNRIPHHISNLI